MMGIGPQELVLLLFFLASLILWIYVLIDILTSEFTGNNKLIWLLLVLLVPLLGVILYFAIGRKQKVKS